MHIQDAEVEWYRQNGKHPERIRKTGTAPHSVYVIGDDCWNKANPHKRELIEPAMRFDIGPCTCPTCSTK